MIYRIRKEKIKLKNKLDTNPTTKRSDTHCDIETLIQYITKYKQKTQRILILFIIYKNTHKTLKHLIETIQIKLNTPYHKSNHSVIIPLNIFTKHFK